MKLNNQIDDFLEVVELSDEELKTVNGGFVPLLIIAGIALLASSCTNGSGNNIQVGGTNNSQTNINCGNCDSITVKSKPNGDKVYVIHR